MSVLTKVFVVLVTVLSVALTALVIAFVANTENFKKQAGDTKAALETAQTQARLVTGELASQKQEFETQIAGYTGQINTSLQQLKSSEDQLAQVRGDLAAAKRDQAKLDAQVTGLSAAMAQNQAILDASLKELAQRRDAAVKLESRAVQLTDRNNELQNQLEAYDRQVRHLNEQLTQLDEEKTKIGDLWAKVPQDIRDRLTNAALAATVEPAQSPVPLQGQITKIAKVGDQTFAQINLGKLDKVGPNMKFLVYRDSKFLANLIIMDVSDKEAIGRIELTQGALTAGDRVMSGVY